MEPMDSCSESCDASPRAAPGKQQHIACWDGGDQLAVDLFGLLVPDLVQEQQARLEVTSGGQHVAGPLIVPLYLGQDRAKVSDCLLAEIWIVCRGTAGEVMKAVREIFRIDDPQVSYQVFGS
jgi:hypothetical protein